MGVSAGPISGALLSMILGITISSQMGLGPTILLKLHSFLVAADAACSKGDLPVVTVEATLVAVMGLATATAATLVPAELAAAVLLAPIAAIGAAHPCRRRVPTKASEAIQNARINLCEIYFATLHTELNTPAVQLSLTTGSNLLSGVLVSDTTLPDPLLPENSL